MPAAKSEVGELKAFAAQQGFNGTLERWDWAYYSRS
jgi:Zn-dependent oligopeptidase